MGLQLYYNTDDLLYECEDEGKWDYEYISKNH